MGIDTTISELEHSITQSYYQVYRLNGTSVQRFKLCDQAVHVTIFLQLNFSIIFPKRPYIISKHNSIFILKLFSLVC